MQFKLVIIAFVLFAVGCGVDQSNSSPKETPTPTPPPKPLPSAPPGSPPTVSLYVGCYFYDHEMGSSWLPQFGHLPWEWAKDDDGNYIVVNGSLVDGFLNVNNISTWWYYGASKDLPKLTETIQTACQNTINRAYPQDQPKLFKATAFASEFSYDEYDLAFPQASASGIDRIITFGDSLSDTGNLYRWTAGNYPNMPVYFMGRFSNGPVWVDYLSQQAHLTIQNWAFGGATTTFLPFAVSNQAAYKDLVIQEIIRPFVTGNLDQYVNYYLDRRYKEDGGFYGLTETDRSRTLFVFWIGANDFFRKVDQPIPLDDMLDTNEWQTMTTSSVDNIMKEARKLRDYGGRHFLFINLPDIGIAPWFAVDDKYHVDDTTLTSEQKRYLLSKKMSIAFKTFNNKLDVAVNQFKSEVEEGAKIILIDTFNLFSQFISQSSTYGFKTDNLQLTLSYPAQGDDRVVNLACLNANVVGCGANAIFWDFVHPTSFAHCWIAYSLHKALWEQGAIDTPPADFATQKAKCLAM